MTCVEETKVYRSPVTERQHACFAPSMGAPLPEWELMRGASQWSSPQVFGPEDPTRNRNCRVSGQSGRRRQPLGEKKTSLGRERSSPLTSVPKDHIPALKSPRKGRVRPSPLASAPQDTPSSSTGVRPLTLREREPPRTSREAPEPTRQSQLEPQAPEVYQPLERDLPEFSRMRWVDLCQRG